MHLHATQVLESLREKNVTSLHHANSVAAACQFIRSKSLLSRGVVERRGIKQTPQSSDRIDKIYSIWFDIFADSVDIHSRVRNANQYGPVLFEFDTELIEKTYTGKLWVTKLNPTKWANKTEQQRWFQSNEELSQYYTKGSFDHMLVFRHCGGELPFKSYLKKIIIDDPCHTTQSGVDLYSVAVGALRHAMADSNFPVEIEKRVCVEDCNCKTFYEENIERTLLMFDPLVM